MVLVGHSFAITGHDDPTLPLVGGAELSHLGLLLFFAISGYLVTASWLSDPRIGVFAFKRGLRIVPGLVVSLVLTAYVLGPLVTTHDRTAYVADPETSSYVTANTLGLVNYVTPPQLGVQPTYHLPGVYESNPQHAVNGSLWTLPVEVRAYALVAIAGLLLALTRARLLGALVLAAACAVAARHNTDLMAVFAGGALLHALRHRVRLNAGLFVLAAFAAPAAYALPGGLQDAILLVAVPYAMFFLAFRGLARLRSLTRPGDVSYGVYIYAWPLQQVVVEETDTASPLAVMLLAGAATYAIALASWRAIEKPALRLKSGMRPSVPAPASSGPSPT
jgi:peptidoglycan/LPS O-acetylase OafA/YrhL